MKTLTEVRWIVRYSDKWGDEAAAEYRAEQDAREFFQRVTQIPGRSAVMYRADITLTPVATKGTIE